MKTPNNASQRAGSIEDYQNTYAEFNVDISKDYKDWVNRYQITEEETKSIRTTVHNMSKRQSNGFIDIVILSKRSI